MKCRVCGLESSDLGLFFIVGHGQRVILCLGNRFVGRGCGRVIGVITYLEQEASNGKGKETTSEA
jgi:hypothetical protein